MTYIKNVNSSLGQDRWRGIGKELGVNTSGTERDRDIFGARLSLFKFST